MTTHQFHGVFSKQLELSGTKKSDLTRSAQELVCDRHSNHDLTMICPFDTTKLRIESTNTNHGIHGQLIPRFPRPGPGPRGCGGQTLSLGRLWVPTHTRSWALFSIYSSYRSVFFRLNSIEPCLRVNSHGSTMIYLLGDFGGMGRHPVGSYLWCASLNGIDARRLVFKLVFMLTTS